MEGWFKENKLSVNLSKTVYTLFHSPNQRDNLPLKLPILQLGCHQVERVTSTKFLGVILDENINWNAHIAIINNKISKVLGIMYKAKPFLDKPSLKLVYNAFLNPYLTYANIA